MTSLLNTAIWSVDKTASCEWDDGDDDRVPTIRVDVARAEAVLPEVHPGPLDSSGGFRGHRIVLEFDVERSEPTTLELKFASERGPCPDLQIVLDGRFTGIFHPAVSREDRSATGEPGPTAGPAEVVVHFPASWLCRGTHQLSISTVLDEASALGEHSGAGHHQATQPSENLPAARAHYGSWFGTYIRWYSATLRRAVDEPSGPPRVRLRPTPMFIPTDEGDLELVDCEIHWQAGAPAPRDIVIDWQGRRLNVPAPPPDRDFGTFRWRFPAPRFDHPVEVTIHHGDRCHTQRVSPYRKWNLHLIPHVHLDLGFTAPQGAVLELHCRNIDRALDRIAVDDDFRFAVDGSVIVQEYQRTRMQDRVDLLHSAIERGRIGVNAFHSNMLTGIASLEELYRATQFTHELPLSSRTSFRYANLTDVPTHSGALPAVLLDQGVQGFVGMSNHARAASDSSDQLHLISPVRWASPDGRTVLAHFADHYSQLRFVVGDPQSVAGATDGLHRYLARYEREDYLPSDLPIIGTHADNEDLGDGDVGFVERWNRSYSWPRMRLSTFDEYLDAVAPLRDQLPIWQSESGSYWEDGVGSAAADFSRYRRTQALLLAAETLGALVTAGSPLRTNRAEFDRGWNDLSVAAEHTFTWARATSHPHSTQVDDQMAWKRRYLDDAHRIAVDETRRHLAQLAETAKLIGPGIIAYNPHAWTADLDAEAELPDGTDLLDADGIVPLEVMTACNGLRRVRFGLNEVPAHSWRFLPMSSVSLTVPGGEKLDRAREATHGPDGPVPECGQDLPKRVGGASGATIEMDGWLIELDHETSLPRCVKHLSSGRDLIDARDGVHLGSILRASSVEFVPDQSTLLRHPEDVHNHERHRTLSIENFRYVPDPPEEELTIESPRLEFVGAISVFDGLRLRWRGAGAGLQHLEMSLLLRRETAACELDVSFEKSPCLDMEAIYVAFPFAGSFPIVRYDRALGWVRPDTDHGAGSSNEWMVHTDGVSFESTDGELVWTSRDAPLFCVGDIVRGAWPDQFPRQAGTLYSYVMNNFWPCNTPPAQSGLVHFSYAFGLREAFDAAGSSRYARSRRLGAMVSEILPLDRFEPGSDSCYREGSLGLTTSNADVDVHLSETGNDQALLRLVNLGPLPARTTVRLPEDYELARQQSDIWVTEGPRGTIETEVRPFATARIQLVRALVGSPNNRGRSCQ